MAPVKESAPSPRRSNDPAERSSAAAPSLRHADTDAGLRDATLVVTRGAPHMPPIHDAGDIHCDAIPPAPGTQADIACAHICIIGAQGATIGAHGPQAFTQESPKSRLQSDWHIVCAP